MEKAGEHSCYATEQQGEDCPMATLCDLEGILPRLEARFQVTRWARPLLWAREKKVIPQAFVLGRDGDGGREGEGAGAESLGPPASTPASPLSPPRVTMIP